MSTKPCLTTLALVTILIATSGCRDPQPVGGPVAANTSGGLSVEDMKKQFDEMKRKAEDEFRRQRELQEHRRSLIDVKFDGFDDDGRVVVEFTNRTGKPIDTLRGGFHAEDLDGNTMGAGGYTIATPGLFLEPDQTMRHVPFTARPELVERLQADPQSVRFSFEALEMTFMDGTAADGLEGS